MKGYIDENGKDRPPCNTCKHKNKMTIEYPCYNCIDLCDLMMHKPNYETEFVYYEKDENNKT